MFTAPLLALALVLSPPTAFDGPSDVGVTASFLGSGDSAGGSQLLPYLAAGVLGTLASGTLAFVGLANSSVGFPGMTILLALAANVFVQAAIPHLFGIPRNFLSSGIGVLGGCLFAVAGGFAGAAIGRASNPSGGGFADLGLAILGMAIGFAIGPPLFTLVDPFGFSRVPVPVATRVRDARPVERS